MTNEMNESSEAFKTEEDEDFRRFQAIVAMHEAITARVAKTGESVEDAVLHALQCIEDGLCICCEGAVDA